MIYVLKDKLKTRKIIVHFLTHLKYSQPIQFFLAYLKKKANVY